MSMLQTMLPFALKIHLLTSFVAQLEEQMVIYGRFGKIVIPHPHYASEVYLYGNDGELKEHFVDQKMVLHMRFKMQFAVFKLENWKVMLCRGRIYWHVQSCLTRSMRFAWMPLVWKIFSG